MRRTSRRRRDYTPEQEASRNKLHRSEMWLNIVSSGISEALRREHYCSDGTRSIIDFVNTELTAAVADLEAASKAHDENFPQRRTRGVVTVSVKNPRPAKKSEKKSA